MFRVQVQSTSVQPKPEQNNAGHSALLNTTVLTLLSCSYFAAVHALELDAVRWHLPL
jgi:heme/copper-type cytochrome/quinol oxidase subunit 3